MRTDAPARNTTGRRNESSTSCFRPTSAGLFDWYLDRNETGLAKPPRKGRRRTAIAAALLGAFAVGAGATALAQRGRAVTFVALTPAPITAMTDWSPVAVKGQVAETFGNKFVIQDDSGRALVETGREGENGGLVAKSEAVTVQGRFEHGFIHAVAIQHADGRNDVVGPPGPPPPRPFGPGAGRERG